jgi:hypothetical protein
VANGEEADHAAEPSDERVACAGIADRECLANRDEDGTGRERRAVVALHERLLFSQSGRRSWARTRRRETQDKPVHAHAPSPARSGLDPVAWRLETKRLPR